MMVISDANEDFDNDQLINVVEVLHGSDPRVLDTDDDGISDYDEVQAGTDPTHSLSPFVERAGYFPGTTKRPILRYLQVSGSNCVVGLLRPGYDLMPRGRTLVM